MSSTGLIYPGVKQGKIMLDKKKSIQLNLFTHGLYNFKHRLYNRMAYAIKTGKIKKGVCYVSGSSLDVEGHHICYDPELKVWLNKRIHLKLHDRLKKLEAQGYTINQDLQERILNEWKVNGCPREKKYYIERVSKLTECGINQLEKLD